MGAAVVGFVVVAKVGAVVATGLKMGMPVVCLVLLFCCCEVKLGTGLFVLGWTKEGKVAGF